MLEVDGKIEEGARGEYSMSIARFIANATGMIHCRFYLSMTNKVAVHNHSIMFSFTSSIYYGLMDKFHTLLLDYGRQLYWS